MENLTTYNFISRQKWEKAINCIDNLNTCRFEKYLDENPYKIFPCVNLCDSYDRNLELIRSSLNLVNLRNIAIEKRIQREYELYPKAQLIALDQAIYQNYKKPSISLKELQDTTAIIYGKALEIREKTISIINQVGKISQIYPELINYPPEQFNFILNNVDEKMSSSKIVAKGILSALKLLILHPFSDGNGRCSRLLICFSLVRAYDLSFAPFLEFFVRARNRHISKCIAYYLDTLDPEPFFLGISGAIRNSLELKM